MVTSDAYANEGQGKSIGPGIMAAFEHLRRHFCLPVQLNVPTAQSIVPAPSSSGNKAEPIPLWLCSKIEALCIGQASNPLTFYMRNLWFQIVTSTRAQDWWRAKRWTRWNVPRSSALVELTVTKSGEEHVVIALDDNGFNGTVPWLEDHLAVIDIYGFATPDFQGGLLTSKTLAHKRRSQASYSDMTTKLLQVAGITKEEMKSSRITAHSPHSVFNSLAAILQWNDTARSDLGRWKNSGGQGCMHHRYSTRASAVNQMYIRSTILSALRDICPPPYPRSAFDLEHIRESEYYAVSMYTGPFVAFSLRGDDDDIKIDEVDV